MWTITRFAMRPSLILYTLESEKGLAREREDIYGGYTRYWATVV